MPTSNKDEKKIDLKQDQTAHEAQTKANKLQRHALDNGKFKKAEKAQGKADRDTEKASSTGDDET